VTNGQRSLSPHSLCLVALLASSAVACSKKPSVPVAPTGNSSMRSCADASGTVSTAHETAPEVTCNGGKRQLLCYGNWAAHCGPDDKLVALTNCRAHGQVCAMHDCSSAGNCTGCQACTPGSVQCGQDGARKLCRDDGSGFDDAAPCDEASGERCSVASGGCEDLCAAAEAEHSYVGCDYWAVATSNSQLAFEGQDAEGLCQPFTFAVIVANAEGIPANVTVQSPGREPRMVTVAPSETQTIDLPCSRELKGKPKHDLLSVRTTKGAHHITSDVPVTVYQFNPLEFKGTGADGGTEYSYTNDASLLLPTSSMTGNYVAIAQPTLLHKLIPKDDTLPTVTHSGPGFVAIIGVDAEPTEVEIISSAYTQPTADGSLPALAPGDHQKVTLAQGEVLQLASAVPESCPDKPDEQIPGGTITYCHVGNEFDLTGTQIIAQGKVSVISGHDCVFLPRNRWACDHLEETMFPVEAWGKEVAVSLSETVACQAKLPNVVRVLSRSDGNRITFTPAVHAPVTLGQNEFVELEFSQDFRVNGSDAILVAQFLLGQEYNGRHTSGSFGKGDPSMSLAIPTEQWRKRYPFLTPETYTDNYVNVIARAHQLVLLDGGAVSGFTPVKGTNLSTARIPIKAGQHVIESQQPFGIVLYGYAPYTSYMMPGGLDLNPINHLF
jgi:hypothetical protein